MSRLWSYLVFQAWMSYLMAAGLLVFTSGFLLNRVSRPERAECTSCTPDVGCDTSELLHNTNHAAEVCLGRKARVVLLIVDALKYEFAEWHDDDASMSSYHRNKLPVIHELLQKQPSRSRLFRFLADPPTTTMQRLKGLTTGSLPTFIEVGSNFASGYINEDNLIEQNAAGGIVFMGDDTWTSLFPGKFLRQFPSPSFNVWDLDSVDKNVQYRIFFEMKKKDWSLLIAHTLGVDHCGHKHGMQHPEMSRKLKDTNKLITEIVGSLEEDMMLFVIGDHGMTETGDHGGDSPSEVEAAMFVYSTSPLLEGFAINGSDSVNQVDLVPTLSSILGTPIPFSNLGSVILDCLPNLATAETTVARLLHPLQSLWRNVAQTKKYIEIYSADANLFSKEQLQNLERVYALLAERVKHVDSLQDLEAFVHDTRDYFKLLKDTCSEVWVQFDSGLISKGLLLMFCSLFFFYLFVTGIPESRMCDIFKSSFLQCAVIANLVTVAVTTCLFLLDMLEELRNTTFFVTGAVSIGFLVLVIAQNWDVISMCWYEHRRIKLLTYVSRIMLLLTVCGLFSNSYIVEEDKVLSFFIITLLCLLVFDLRRSDSDSGVERRTSRFAGTKPSRPNFRAIVLSIGLVACVSVRLSHYFWRCREEHLQRACSVSATGKLDWSTVSNHWERVLPAVVILALYVTVVKLWLRDRGNLTGFAPSVMVGQYCSVLIGVCISCYWVLQQLPKFYKVKFVLSWQVKTLPNVVYLLCVLAILILYYRPLSIYILPKKRESIEVYREENLVPRLFEKIKDSISRKRIDTDDTPVICGIGTTYSAAFISLSVFLTLLYSLLLGDSLSPSTFLLFVTCTCVLGLSTIERYKNANTISELLDVSMPVLFCWFLLAEYFFYGTGHQATFPTIHWHAAFVGTGGHFYGHLMSAILIGINTFGSHIILGATLPLLVIVPFTLHLVFPKFLKAKFLEDDMKRGELLFLLSEQDSAFQAAIFSVAGKYVLLHGIRTFGSMLAATIHCRHLMVWKIFAPKLIFEGLGFLVTLCSVLASFYLVFRIEQQMEYVITRITKGR